MIASRMFLVYIAVGIICAFTDIGIMQLLIYLKINYLLATTIGFSIGLILNFYLHTRVTFKARYTRYALVRYLGVVLINYFLTLLIVFVFQWSLNMPLLGKIVSLPIIAVNGFLLIKHWVYKR